ncbi:MULTISPECIES: BlaI/MecI/CopY family transcriptional regulator [Aerococcus]|uniref:BlaI/MecI/CopY family transcriptional regulator n=1 Tax=Aerococcus TaxID=1375 RepID=UPI000DCD1375|nr:MULTISPECIES: BlaI/MecI/CopY family transcriptional regulator [Aerococcus]KAA9299581.1 CopY/TcrY family copper transport repressor [Aerococcus tenax]MDK6689694.1 BlaI/MecI/CopY family transcriptional regulator [Aerococcus urinae]MDK8132066.1 BlaI/MecI/CopY family transcriptional regulator [Aerococcus urinae]MDL5178415.1 BlaI/MecI/CopY family transcriptional regulator [Aerococcus tenax]RAV70165.1 CopY/TcrY family copper transport repressor [Aerococcus urinae]
MTKKNSITDSEHQVLRVIWAQGATTSRFVIDSLSEKTGWKPTTIKTLLHRLVNKGYLATEKKGGQYLYHPLISEASSQVADINNLLKQHCRTHADQLIIDMIQQSDLDQGMQDNIFQALRDKDLVPTVTCHCIPGQCECHKDIG